MCNCVRKCVSFRGFPQFVVILPVKRFAGDSRAKRVRCQGHKKAPRTRFYHFHSCQFEILRAPSADLSSPLPADRELFQRSSTTEAFGTAGNGSPASRLFTSPARKSAK